MRVKNDPTFGMPQVFTAMFNHVVESGAAAVNTPVVFDAAFVHKVQGQAKALTGQVSFTASFIHATQGNATAVTTPQIFEVAFQHTTQGIALTPGGTVVFESAFAATVTSQATAPKFIKFMQASFAHKIASQATAPAFTKLFTGAFAHFVEGTSAAPDVPVPAGLLLDDYPNAAAAFSLRQLRTGVTNVVRVRRSQDDAEQDFTAAEIADGTLASWVGVGNDGFLVEPKEQGLIGVANPESVVTLQAQIVSNGALLLRSGISMFRGQIGNSYSNLAINPFNNTTGSSSFFVVSDSLITGERNRIFANSPNIFLSQIDNASNNNRISVRSGIALNGTNNAYTQQAFILEVHIRPVEGVLIRINGVDYLQDASVVFANNVINNLFANAGSRLFVAEVVYYEENKEADMNAILANINDYYGIY
jgi:hypothetical protein